VFFVEKSDGLTRNQSESQLVMMTVPEMDRAVNVITRVTADQLMEEHLRVKHAHMDNSVYPIMRWFVKWFSHFQMLLHIVAFCASVARTLPALLEPALSICRAALQTLSLPIRRRFLFL
jgi:hypothetical protein